MRAMKLFEKDDAGLLHEVPADQVAVRRSAPGARVGLTSFNAEVLWNAAEIAAQTAAEAATKARVEAMAAEEAEKARKLAAAAAKLTDLGLTPEDLDILGLTRPA